MEVSQKPPKLNQSHDSVSKNTKVLLWLIAFVVIAVSSYLVSHIYDNADYRGLLSGLSDTFVAIPAVILLIALSVIYGTVLLTKGRPQTLINVAKDDIGTKVEQRLYTLTRSKLILLTYVIIPGIIILTWWVSAGSA